MPSVQYSLASEGGSITATNVLSPTYAVEHLIDGDDSNFYHSAGGLPITVEITLPFSVLIDQIYLGFLSTQIRSYTIDCLVGGSWVTKETVSSATESSHTYNPTPFVATKVRYVVSADNYTVVRMLNFKVFGTLPPDTSPPTDIVLGSTTALSSTSARFAFTPATDSESPIAGILWQFDVVNTFDSGSLIEQFVASNTSPYDRTGLTAGRRWYARAKGKDSATPTPNLSADWSNIAHVDLDPVADFSLDGLNEDNEIEATDPITLVDESIGAGLDYEYHLTNSAYDDELVAESAEPNILQHLKHGSNSIRQVVTVNGLSDSKTIEFTVIDKVITIEAPTLEYDLTGLPDGLVIRGYVEAVNQANLHSEHSNQATITVVD